MFTNGSIAHRLPSPPSPPLSVNTVVKFHSKEFNGIGVISFAMTNGMYVVDFSVSEPSINCATNMTKDVHGKNLIVISDEMTARVLLSNHFAIKSNEAAKQRTEADKQRTEADKQRSRQPDLVRRDTGVSFESANSVARPLTFPRQTTGPVSQPPIASALPTTVQAMPNKGDKVMASFDNKPFEAIFVKKNGKGLYVVNFKISEDLIKTHMNEKLATRINSTSNIAFKPKPLVLQFAVPPSKVTPIPTPPAPTLEGSKVDTKLTKEKLSVTTQSFVPEIVRDEKNLDLIDRMLDELQDDTNELQDDTNELQDDANELQDDENQVMIDDLLRDPEFDDPMNHPDTKRYPLPLDEKA